MKNNALHVKFESWNCLTEMCEVNGDGDIRKAKVNRFRAIPLKMFHMVH